MESAEDAERCIKYLNQSVLEGRYITIERVMYFSMAVVVKKQLYLSFFFLTWRFSGYIQNALHQLCWQRSKMISTSMWTLVKQLIRCVWSTKHSNYIAQQLYNLSIHQQLSNQALWYLTPGINHVCGYKYLTIFSEARLSGWNFLIKDSLNIV